VRATQFAVAATNHSTLTSDDMRSVEIFVIIKYIYTAHFRRMPQMRWRTVTR